MRLVLFVCSFVRSFVRCRPSSSLLFIVVRCRCLSSFIVVVVVVHRRRCLSSSSSSSPSSPPPPSSLFISSFVVVYCRRRRHSSSSSTFIVHRRSFVIHRRRHFIVVVVAARSFIVVVVVVVVVVVHRRSSSFLRSSSVYHRCSFVHSPFIIVAVVIISCCRSFACRRCRRRGRHCCRRCCRSFIESLVCSLVRSCVVVAAVLLFCCPLVASRARCWCLVDSFVGSCVDCVHYSCSAASNLEFVGSGRRSWFASLTSVRCVRLGHLIRSKPAQAALRHAQTRGVVFSVCCFSFVLLPACPLPVLLDAQTTWAKCIHEGGRHADARLTDPSNSQRCLLCST